MISRSAKAAGTASRRQRPKRTPISRHKRIVIVIIAIILVLAVLEIVYDIFCSSSNDGLCPVLKAIKTILDKITYVLPLLLPLAIIGLIIAVFVVSWILVGRRW